MREIEDRPRKPPEHLGLAHDVWAPDPDPKTGKMRDEDRDAWLDRLVEASEPDRDFLASYRVAFQRWRGSLCGPGDLTFVVQAQTRLLIGHGNPAPTEVGITLHRTWGVPYLPGSALKGVLARALGARGGCVPDGVDGRDVDRLLGVPPTGDRASELAGGARRGKLVVHDALWSPPDDATPPRPLLHRDVLTPHHSTYYRDERSWPTDHEDPIPVSFVTVRPGTEFLVALSCPDPDLLSLAATHLAATLAERGIGGKTTAGYGRLTGDPPRPGRTRR